MSSITVKWGNPYTATINVTKDSVPVDLSIYDKIMFTVKDILEPEDDTKAVIGPLEVEIDPDQVVNTGKATLNITYEENKIRPLSYKADLKFFKDDIPVNTDMFTYCVKEVVGKDD